MSEEKGKKVSKPGPIRVSKGAHLWLSNEQNRALNENRPKPSFAELIDDLIQRVSGGRLPQPAPRRKMASNE